MESCSWYAILLGKEAFSSNLNKGVSPAVQAEGRLYVLREVVMFLAPHFWSLSVAAKPLALLRP